jgi:hypothetical protein
VTDQGAPTPARSETEYKPGELGHSTDGPDVDVGRHTRRTLASFSMTDKVSSASKTLPSAVADPRTSRLYGGEGASSSSSRGGKKAVSSARSF